MRVIVDSGCGEDITYLCREDSRDMFYRPFDIEGAIPTVDVLNIDDDLRLTFKFFFLLFHGSSKDRKGHRA